MARVEQKRERAPGEPVVRRLSDTGYGRYFEFELEDNDAATIYRIDDRLAHVVLNSGKFDGEPGTLLPIEYYLALAQHPKCEVMRRLPKRFDIPIERLARAIFETDLEVKTFAEKVGDFQIVGHVPGAPSSFVEIDTLKRRATMERIWERDEQDFRSRAHGRAVQVHAQLVRFVAVSPPKDSWLRPFDGAPWAQAIKMVPHRSDPPVAMLVAGDLGSAVVYQVGRGGAGVSNDQAPTGGAGAGGGESRALPWPGYTEVPRAK